MSTIQIIRKKTVTDNKQLVSGKYKNTKEKGDVYEQYILDYLYLENSKRQIWLWSNIPQEIMCDVGLIGNWNEFRLQCKSNRINKLPDVGCDIFMIDTDKYYLIQCKNYASNNSIKIDDLAGWHGMLLDYPEMFGDLYYTSKLSENIKARKPNPRIRYFPKPYEHIEPSTPTIANVNANILKPREYQIEAYNALKDKQRTVLQLPCGMGKTLISTMLASHYELVVFISPLKAFCEQNSSYFKTQLPNYNCIIVDSDGTRDIKTLTSILANSGKIALFATYKSVDIIMQLYDNKLLTNAYFIIDEFHNIPYDDAICYDDDESILDEAELSDSDANISDEDNFQEDDELEMERDKNADGTSNIEEDEKDNVQSPIYRLLHSDAKNNVYVSNSTFIRRK